MTLLERCRTLQDKRKKLVILNSNIQETTALQEHASKLKDLHSEFFKIVEIRRTLLEENIPLQSLNFQNLQEISEVISRIKKRFRENPRRKVLVFGNDWPTFTVKMKALISSIRENCQQGWREYTDEFFSKTVLVENMVVKTDSNINRINEYKRLLQEVRSLINDWDKRSSVVSFRSKEKILLELTKELNEFQAPNDVKKFFEAVSTDGGAPLHLLTDDVVTWLKEQKMYSRYKIVGGF